MKAENNACLCYTTGKQRYKTRNELALNYLKFENRTEAEEVARKITELAGINRPFNVEWHNKTMKKRVGDCSHYKEGYSQTIRLFNHGHNVGVLIHELAHLENGNHSKRFYAEDKILNEIWQSELENDYLAKNNVSMATLLELLEGDHVQKEAKKVRREEERLAERHVWSMQQTICEEKLTRRINEAKAKINERLLPMPNKETFNGNWYSFWFAVRVESRWGHYDSTISREDLDDKQKMALAILAEANEIGRTEYKAALAEAGL